MQDLRISSQAFADGDSIPAKYTCKGIDVSPPLDIRGVPPEAASLAIVMHDPDAPHGDFLHWSVWNLNTDIVSLGEDELPDNAIQGTNDFGQTDYRGPCPPSGVHHYAFDLYALDAELDLPEGADREELMDTINDHAIAQTTLTGTFDAA